MDRLWLDLETYNETDIGVGTYRYAETASILLFAWAIDDEPAQVWDVASGAPMPPELGEALVLTPEVWAHNAMFDRTILRAVMPELTPGIERWRCTMVQAYMHGLPGSLDTLCDVFGLPQDQAKLKDGKRLVQLFCKPLPRTRKIRRATADTNPEEWARFVEYARNDIVAMRELHRRMPRWNYPMNDSELTLWHLDQAINDRGVAVDRELARGALAAVAQAQEQMAQQVRAATGGVVESATKRDALLEYMASHYGIILDDLQGHTIDKALSNDLIPEPVKELLRVRAQVSSTSTAKYQTLIDAANSDGRLRGLLQFSGAARTSRWCIAKGSLVLTKEVDGRITKTPIEEVTIDQLVWDGEAWVEHEGVVFSGLKDVIEHDGVVATREHVVYLDATTNTTLGEAADAGLTIWSGYGVQGL